MRVFLSHSSKHKPLVREVVHYLPEHVRPWIDEKQLLIGDSLDKSIKDALQVGTDFVVLFVDMSSATSTWVRKELRWALEHESHIGRTFVLPVVLDTEAWELIEPAEFRNRKYISCADFSEEGIRTLANSLTSHLFAWLSREAPSRSATPPPDPLQQADQYLLDMSYEVRRATQRHGKANPLPLVQLYERLGRNPNLRISSVHQMTDFLLRLRQHGYLAGIVCHKDSIYVEEAYYRWKSTANEQEKLLIAKKAIQFIDSSMVVVLDGGSTTMYVAREICDGIRLRAWERLTIVTNSLPVATDILKTAEDVGLEDNNDIVQVLITGGRIRTNTLAVVPVTGAVTTDFEALLEPLAGKALSFVGANGVNWDEGFTTHDNPEIKTKRAMLRHSKRKFLVIDPVKFDLKQENVFAGFDENIEVITTRTGHVEEMERFAAKISQTSTKLIFAD
jgi:DeoR/GlpR family transcriptional regulator of sugar metabolism